MPACLPKAAKGHHPEEVRGKDVKGQEAPRSLPEGLSKDTSLLSLLGLRPKMKQKNH